MTRKPSSLPLLAVLALAVGGWWAWGNYGHLLPGEKLGAGTPLDQTKSQISILSPTSEETPSVLPTNTRSRAIIGEPGGKGAPIILTSATVITTPAAPLVDDTKIKAAQLGAGLALLAQAYSSGGPQALATLNAAAPLGGSELKARFDDLRAHTPAIGPVTSALLLTEARRVKALGAPGSATDEKPVAGDWLRNLVKIRNLRPANSADWNRASDDLLLKLAGNQTAEAQAALAAVPLAGDARLDGLRASVKAYAEQAASLNALVNAYLQQAAGVTP